MSTGVIISIVVFVLLIGGLVTLYQTANKKFPDNYDKTKTGFDDEEDDY